MEPMTPSGRLARRVRAYLRCLGLRDEQVLGELTGRIMEIAEQARTTTPEQAAMEECFRLKDSCYSAMSEKGNAAAQVMVGWQLRAVLKDHPEELLAAREFHTASAQGLAVPESHQELMPIQPLGDMPAPLRKEFWRKVAWRLRSTGSHLIGRFRGT